MATTPRFRADEHPRDLAGRFTRKARPEPPDAALTDWANLRVARGYDLPELAGGAAAL